MSPPSSHLPHPTAGTRVPIVSRGRARTVSASPGSGRRTVPRRATAALLAGLLALALAPAVVEAQFATGLTPPRRAPSPAAVAAAESTSVAVRDSVAREQRLDMKAWVDSAAASLEVGGSPVAPIPTSPRGDTLRGRAPSRPAAPPQPRPPAQTRPARPVSPPPPAPPQSPSAAPGALPPDTATPLPLLALVGSAMLGGGAALLRGRP